MKFLEIALLVILFGLITAGLVPAFRSKDRSMFWSPLTLFAAVFGYYFFVGPLIALAQDQTIVYGMEMRHIMWKAWLVGVVGLSSIYLGFWMHSPHYKARFITKLTPILETRLKQWIFLLCGLGILGFVYNAYVSGMSLLSMLFPFHASTGGLPGDGLERDGVAAGNYLFLAINCFIPAMCLLTTLLAKSSLWKRVLIIGPLTVQIILYYASFGFRHRIVILILALAATSYLLRRKRPAILTILLSGSGIILLAGFIVMTRNYGKGLDLSQIADSGVSDVFLGGFNDCSVFFTTAQVVDSIPSTLPFIGLEPIWVALTIPIPRSIWPEKPLPMVLSYFNYLTGTGGQATPMSGDHYIMAGWFGVIIGGILVGLMYKRFWLFYRSNPRNPIILTMYAVSWALIFPLVNRGYLAQTCMEYFFDWLPLVVLYFSCRKMMTVASRSSIRRRPRFLRLKALAKEAE